MSNLAPIDIKYGELLVWLQERYLIPKDWPKRIEAISSKKAEVMDDVYKRDNAEFKKIQDMFKNVRNDMKYMDMIKLNQSLLKTEEAKSKTLFGSYNSQLIRDSNLLINLYEKNNVHLCESSKFIIQNIGYEIPNCDKTIAYNERTINDYLSKNNEKTLNIERNKEKLKNLFKSYSIAVSNDIKEISVSLIKQMKQLPMNLLEIEKLLKNEKIKKISDAYKKFYKTFYNTDLESVDKDFQINLKSINEKGDTATGSYSFVDKTVDNLLDSLSSSENLETAVWNLKLAGENKTTTLLISNQSRKKIINDLNELKIFLTTRQDQMKKEEELNLTMYQTNLRNINEEQNPEFITNSIKFLNNVLDKLTNKEFTFLVNIYEDEKNLVTILNSFENIHKEDIRLTKEIKENEDKITEIKKEIKELQSKIDQFKKDSKLIKKVMEKFLTDHLKRKITIIGDINLI
jgi:hypothetical protein